jgi:hypothetical protein
MKRTAWQAEDSSCPHTSLTASTEKHWYLPASLERARLRVNAPPPRFTGQREQHESVYLIEHMNNEKEKGEGGRGEAHDIQMLSERHQQKKPAYKWGNTFSQRCGPHIRRAPSLC